MILLIKVWVLLFASVKLLKGPFVLKGPMLSPFELKGVINRDVTWQQIMKKVYKRSERIVKKGFSRQRLEMVFQPSNL